MATQSMVAVAFILLSVSIAALLTRYRVSGHLEWIMASALVALGGVPALWLAADWAGWLSATLFVLLIALPLALLDRARVAAQRGQWKKAARFHWWAYLLHPTPWTRFGLTLRRALSDDRPGAYLAALNQALSPSFCSFPPSSEPIKKTSHCRFSPKKPNAFSIV